MKKFKKTALCCAMALIFAGTTLVFAGCGNSGKAKVFNNVTDLYGFAGATTALLLDNASTTTVDSLALTEDEIAKIGEINKNMNMLEGIIGGKKPVNVSVEETDNEVYKHKLTIEINALSGKTEMKMYYNETLLDNEEIDIEDSDEEEEVESKLTGIIKIGEQEFAISGKKEVEGDEVELEFEARINNGNYVKFKQETELGEQEFSYELYDKDENLLDKVEFELEIEDEELEIEYKFLDSNSQIQKYKMEKLIENNVEKIKLSYTNNGETTVVKITVEKQQEKNYYVYNINNGETILRFQEGDTNPAPEMI